MAVEPLSNGEVWRGYAFGLLIESPFAFDGFPAGHPEGARPLPRVSVLLSSEQSVRRPFDQGSSPLAWRRGSSGEPLTADVMVNPEAGFLVFNPRIGYFHLSGRADQVRAAPADPVTWRWQRYLLGRVLPFAATLHGLEPWHASAVAIDDAAIALVANSTVGKTTIAAELMLLGADFVADDVISLSSDAGAVIVHPAPPLMSVRTRPNVAFSQPELDRLGPTVGQDNGSVRLAVQRAERPLPVRALYILDRTESGKAALEPSAAPDPARLLGGTFNFALRTSDRLRRQLDVASLLAQGASFVRVRIPADADLRELARAILEDAQERVHRTD